MNPSRRVVHLRIASLRTGLAGAGVLLALAGCSATNPATIATPFNPGEGASAQIGGEPGNGGNDGNYQGNGGIKLRNFLLVSQGGGAGGVLVGAISNDTGQPATVQLEVAEPGTGGQQQSLGSTTVDLKAGEFVRFGNPAAASGSAGATGTQSGATGPAGGQSAWFQLNSVTSPPGSVIKLFARTQSLGGTSLNMPILPPVEYYATLTPTAAANPSPSGTISPTGTPSVSANPSGAAHQSPSPSASSS